MINLNHPCQTNPFMSAALHLKSSPAHRIQKKPLSKKVEIGINSLSFVIVILIAIISLAYLVNANKNATKGYALKTLEVKRTQLLTENEIWDMQIAKAQSLATIQNDPRIKKMVQVEKPLFIRGDTAIASK